MTRTRFSLSIIIATLILMLGSFSDEATLVSFALSLADEPSHLTYVYALSMIGGIVASRGGAYLLPKISERIILPTIFGLQALVIIGFYFTQSALGILLFSFGLGALGALLWTVFLAVLPSYFKDNLSLANKLAHTIRNLGSVFAPALTGFIFAIIHKQFMIILAVISFVCLLLLCLINIMQDKNNAPTNHANTDNHNNSPIHHTTQTISYRTFVSHPIIKKVLPLFTITIALTSALNILIIPYINQQLNLSAAIYGATLSMMSLGSLISPLLFSGLFGKVGRVSGAYLGASFMGLGMIGMAMAAMAVSIRLACCY